MKLTKKLSVISVAALFALAGCGGGGTTSSPSVSPTGGGAATEEQPAAAIVAAVAKDDAAAALLPESYAQSGALKVGTNLQFPPHNFYAADGKTPIGFEVDLSASIAKKLGLTASWQDSPFENLITSLQANRVDMTIAAMNDRPDRQEKIDFVNYFRTGIAILVAKGNPDGIAAPEDLCGHTVGVGVGSSQEAWAEGLSGECVAAGKEPIEVVPSNNDQQRLNSVKTGRQTAELNDLANLVWIARTSGGGNDFEVVDLPPLQAALYGIGVNKENAGLRDAIAAALNSLIADGSYGKILDAWGVSSGAVDEATINQGK